MHKVLVNPGSAVGLLQIPTFKKMKLSLGVLNLVERIVSSFNGGTTITLEDITLPVKVGLVT